MHVTPSEELAKALSGFTFGFVNLFVSRGAAWGGGCSDAGERGLRLGCPEEGAVRPAPRPLPRS